MIPNRLFVLMVSFLSLLGCSTPDRVLSRNIPPYVSLPNGRHPLSPQEPSRAGRETPGGMIQELEQRLGRKLTILEISGGAQNGAFGAGVLNGWSQTGTRPSFDIVTGVSVGALLSSHAFLGTPEDDAVLKEIFTTISKEKIYRRKRLFSLLRGGTSILDSKPLADLIAQYITQDTLDRVAAEYRRGRRLAVGTVNLDYKQVWVWDLTQIAASEAPGALALYRKVLLASASPPLAFPPVEIDGSLFADGGTRDRLMVAGLGMDHLDVDREPSGVGEMYIIFNDKSTMTPRAVRPTFRGVINSSLHSMLNGQLEATMLRAYAIAKIHRYEFRLVHIPNDLDMKGDFLSIDPEEINNLFEAGERLARQPDAWLDKPPVVQNFTPAMLDAFEKLRF